MNLRNLMIGLFLFFWGGLFFHSGMAYEQHSIAVKLDDESKCFMMESGNGPFGYRILEIQSYDCER